MIRGPGFFVALGALAVLLSACGDDGGVGVFADGGEAVDGSQAIDGGLPSVDASPPTDGPMDLDGPLITVLSPTAPASGDFSSTALVTEDRFTASCRAEANPNSGSPVNGTSVRIVVFAGNMSREAFAQPTTVADVYSAQIVVTGFPNGLLTVRCTASDSQAEPLANSSAIETYLDLGPTVSVFVPIQNASYANQLDVMFLVTAAPVAAADAAGAVVDTNNVQLFVAGEELTSLANNGNGLFSATALFDAAIFDPPLEGANTVTILAPNSRSPTGTVREVNVVFLADSHGPTIIVTSPTPGELVSGIVAVTATITDNAGINDLSVVATMAGIEEFDLFNVGGDQYMGTFDTRELGLGMVFPTMVVRAQDSIGNQSSVGYVIALDNRPPMIDLDSPLMREWRYDVAEDQVECSWIFDPLGSDATDDGESVAQLSEMRVRIEDRANGATDNSGVVVPKALVYEGSVQLFILDNENGALIVDTDGDGECDEINPLLTPTSVPMTSTEAAVINMVELSPLGKSTFLPTPPLEPYGTLGPLFTVCEAPDPGGSPAEAMCPVSSPATRRIHDHLLKDVPAVYGIPPVDDESICMGYGFDSFATNISDGWACVAVRAEDNLGNVSVSAPLRVCFDSDGDMAECPAWGVITTNGLPDCSGTFDPMTGMTDVNDDCTLPVQFDDVPYLQLRKIDI